MRSVGIDPGLEGAIALICSERGKVEIVPMPVDDAGTEIRADELHSLLYRLKPDLVVVEKLHGMPGFGAANFKFGGSYYAPVYVTQILHIPLVRVTPQVWKKAILPGTKKDKKAAIKWAKDYYPDVILRLPGKRALSHDFAEALALAEYGIRMMGGGQPER